MLVSYKLKKCTMINCAVKSHFSFLNTVCHDLVMKKDITSQFMRLNLATKFC
jgi:hypothetical protein